MENKIVKHGIAEISPIVAGTTLAPLAAAAGQDESHDAADEVESNLLAASKKKLQIKVSGISPPPLGWRGENVRIICTRCQAVFDLRREAGVFVKRLELRG